MKQVSQDIQDTTAAIVDGIIKLLASGSFIATALLIPNFVQVLDKPFGHLIDDLDARRRDREFRRIIYYMKSRGLIKYEPKDYEHGIRLTKRGKDRLKKVSFESITIPHQQPWDKKWRLVFFDIPEALKAKRNSLNLKLKRLGYKQLQFSIWIHPFQSRAEIEAVCEYLGIRRYVSYIEITEIDSKQELKKRFKHILI